MTVTTPRRERTDRPRKLADQLVSCLASRDAGSNPMVLENHIANTKSVHVTVIWDRWAEHSPSEREKIIRDACAQTKRLHGRNITAAMGVTSEEAVSMGFLPYSIVTTRRKGDTVSPQALAAAMKNVGGIVTKVGSFTQLRFATRQQAEDAYRLLTQKVPGPYWAIVQEQSSGE